MLKLKTILQSKILIYIIFIIILILSFIRISNYKSVYSLNTKIIEGTLIDKQIDGNKLSIIIKEKEKIKGTYYIETEKELDELKKLELGSKIRIFGELNIPNNNTIKNTFNYRSYLKSNKIFLIMNIDKIEILENNKNIIYAIKNKMNNYINTFKTKDYLSMFILGNKANMDDVIINKFQKLGISHLFAISGMHISIITLILLKLLNKIKENIRYLIVISFLLFYVFLTGGVSILRSVSLFICLYINRKYDLCMNNEQICLISISLLLIINPFLLTNIGFLYSGIITYSLIKFSYLISGNYLKKIFTISIISLLVSLPITINTNYEINILSIIYNLVYVPLISLFIFPLSLLTFIIKPLDSFLLLAIDFLELITNHFFTINVILPKMNWYLIIIYYIFLYCLFRSYNKKYLLIIIILLAINKDKYVINNNLSIIYFDVSQGDSILINKKEETVLIDTGGKIKFKLEEWKKRQEYNMSNNIIQYMKSVGITKINYLIISHGDYDHMGESINLVENFKVEKVIFNCGPLNDLESKLINILEQKNIKYYSCVEELMIDKYKLYFLNTGVYDNENDNSSVIYLNYNNYKFLFMGDASVEREKNILEKYNISNIDVLKVGHHGSKTSSGKNFIDEISPKYSIISVGKNNRYGHPNKEVLDSLEDSKIYRTDIDGSIIFKIQNNKLKIETCSP